MRRDRAAGATPKLPPPDGVRGEGIVGIGLRRTFFNFSRTVCCRDNGERG